MSFFKSDKFKNGMKAAVAQLDEEQQDALTLSASIIAPKLKNRVIGQDRISDLLAETIELRSAMEDAGKPLSTVFLSGPTGTGKTELAKALAEAVYGKKEALYRIDCGSLGTQESSMAKIIGSPKVYSNSSRGSLCEFLEVNKKGCVILFDEFEKAAPDADSPVAKFMLNLTDEGRVQSNYDDKVYDATKSVVMLTSNLEQEKLGEIAKQTEDPDELEFKVKALLRDHYAPEFFERFDLVSTVDPLTNEARMEIVAIKLSTIAKKYKAEIVDHDEGLFDLLIQGARKWGNTSSRGIIRWLEKLMAKEIIDAVRNRKLSRLVADYDINTNTFSVRDADATPPVIEEEINDLDADAYGDQDDPFKDIDFKEGDGDREVA